MQRTVGAQSSPCSLRAQPWYSQSLVARQTDGRGSLRQSSPFAPDGESGGYDIVYGISRRYRDRRV